MTRNFYNAFEERFRGSREEIKLRLRAYIPLVEPFCAMHDDRTAVDLGCGRGEWLEVLQELRFDAVGVDLDDGMLAACRASRLQVEQREAVTYLKDLASASVTVVSGFHLAEHLAFPDLQELVREAFRVLRPAGLLILETPNPENILVGASRFYLDPTHQRPLPPMLLAFLPEYYGFARTTILRLNDPAGLAHAASVQLLDVLGGVSPDYAIVAQKEADTPGHAALFDDTFRMATGLQLEALAFRYDHGLSLSVSEAVSRADRSADLATRTEHQIARLEADFAGQNRELMETQRLLAEMQQQLATRVSGGARDTAGSIRRVAALTGRMKTMTAQFGLWIKAKLKPSLVRAGAFVAGRPALKARLMKVLRLAPRLYERLGRVVRPGLVEAATVQHTEGPQRIEDLTETAKGIYRDLVRRRGSSSKQDARRSVRGSHVGP